MSVESPRAKPHSRTQAQPNPATLACPRCKSRLLFFLRILCSFLLTFAQFYQNTLRPPIDSSVTFLRSPLQSPSPGAILSSAQPPTFQSEPSRSVFNVTATT